MLLRARQFCNFSVCAYWALEVATSALATLQGRGVRMSSFSIVRAGSFVGLRGSIGLTILMRMHRDVTIMRHRIANAVNILSEVLTANIRNILPTNGKVVLADFTKSYTMNFSASRNLIIQMLYLSVLRTKIANQSANQNRFYKYF